MATQASSWIDAISKPPDINRQIDSVYRELAAQGARVARRWQGQLHGPKSLVLVIRKADLDARRMPTVSDELRVYDVDDARLKLRLRFSPTGLYRAFRLVTVDDFDANGQRELLGTFQPGNNPIDVLPLVVSWSAARHRYEMLPAVASAPFATGRYRRYFNERQFLRDRFSETVVWGYRTTAIMELRRRSRVFLAGFRTGSETTVAHSFTVPRARAANYCGPTSVSRVGLLRVVCTSVGVSAAVPRASALDVQGWHLVTEGTLMISEPCRSESLTVRVRRSPLRSLKRTGTTFAARSDCTN